MSDSATKLSDILIARQEDIPAQIVEDFVETLQILRVSFQTEETERRIYNAIEYLIPTALLVFLAKPFFDGFLKKAGEDSYKLFVAALGRLIQKANLLKVRIVKSGEYKVAETSPYSRVFSIYSNVGSGARIKFLFPVTCSDVELTDMIDSMLKDLQMRHSPASTTHALHGNRPKHTLEVFCYDNEAKQWREFSQLTAPGAVDT